MRADSQSSPSLSHLPTVGLLSVLVIVELARGYHAHGFTRLLIIYSTYNFQTGLSFLLSVKKHDRFIVERKLRTIGLSIVTVKSRNKDYQSCIANKIP